MRYWFHPESDCHFSTLDSEEVSWSMEQECIELEASEYFERTLMTTDRFKTKRPIDLPRDAVMAVQHDSLCYTGIAGGMTCHKTGIDVVIIARTHKEVRKFITAYSEPDDYDSKITHPVAVLLQRNVTLKNGDL